MTESLPPVLVTVSLQAVDKLQAGESPKILLSSLLRTFFNGELVSLGNRREPAFKVERRTLREIHLEGPASQVSSNHFAAKCELLSRLPDLIDLQPQQWIIYSDAAGIALRNIDHLLPPDEPLSPASKVDFYSIDCGAGDQPAPGFWAIRARHLTVVLDAVRRTFHPNAPLEGMPEAWWRDMISDLTVHQAKFEKGEVLAPSMDALDWGALIDAAFITLSEWPRMERWKLLQALHFGNFLGDERGLLLDIFEA